MQMHKSKIRKRGRPPRMMKCRLCDAKLPSVAMRLHEPTCRRQKLLVVGAQFSVMLSQRVVPVRIEEFLEGSEAMVCRNLRTGRLIKVKSPRRFREWMSTANVRYMRGKKGQNDGQ